MYNNLCLYVPLLKELDYRQCILAQPETMSYNKGYELRLENYNNDNGCIYFEEKYWNEWYDKWVNGQPDKYYAYFKDKISGKFVGDISFRYEKSKDAHCIGIVIEDKHRGNGYSTKGLILLAEKAFNDLGVDKLRNDIPIERIYAIKGHKKAGFKEICIEDGQTILVLSKEDYLANKHNYKNL